MRNMDPEQGTRIRSEERGSGARNEDQERGTRIWNGIRNTLRPCVNSIIIRGNEDPPCVHMGGTSDPLSRCIIKSKFIGNYAFGDRKSRDTLISQ